MKKRSFVGSALSGIAACSLVVGGVLAAPAAFASDGAGLTAPTDDAGYRDFVRELVSADTAITGVSQDGRGNIFVAAANGALAPATHSYLTEFDNILVKSRPVAQTYGGESLVGGSGYAVNRMKVCSLGLSGWSPTGEPAMFSAGHCGVPGSLIERTRPSFDDAPFYPAVQPGYSPVIFDRVGVVGFAQWGGPGGTVGGGGNLDSTDISVVNVTNQSLSLLPQVTDWQSWESDDLSASGTPVTAVGTARVGDRVTRSGRSTGVAPGAASGGAGASVVEDNAWTRVCESVAPVPTSCRWVYGFWVDGDARAGDSGGPFLRGTTAVGILSAGSGGMSFATDLVNGLRVTGGYTVMLDLEEPVVTSAATVAPGGIVRGTGGAGMMLRVSSADSTFDVPVGENGTWSFAAPSTPGTIEYALQIADAGYNRSESVPYTLTVTTPRLAPPTITVPGAGASVTGPTVTFSGTGEPTAVLTLTGDVAASTTVSADGDWTVVSNVDYGAASVTVTQSTGGASAVATVDFVVIPPAPTLTSPASGSTLAAAPTEVTGTALPGATVTVVLNGTPLGTTQVPGSRATASAPVEWSMPVPTTLASGDHELEAVQTVRGAESTAARATFTVAAPWAPEPQPKPERTPGRVPASGVTSPHELAGTGGETAAASGAALIGGGLLLSGLAFLLVTRRLRNRA